MPTKQKQDECLIDSPGLECIEKRDSTTGGVLLSHLKLQCSLGYTVSLTVPAGEAANIELGGTYKILLLPVSREPLTVDEIQIHSMIRSSINLIVKDLAMGAVPQAASLARNLAEDILPERLAVGHLDRSQAVELHQCVRQLLWSIRNQDVSEALVKAHEALSSLHWGE